MISFIVYQNTTEMNRSRINMLCFFNRVRLWPSPPAVSQPNPYSMSIFSIYTFYLLFLSVFSPAAPAQVRTNNPSSLESGLAVVYKDQAVGKTLANGEKYDPKALTIAHRIYPFRTKVKLVNPSTKDTLEVTVNDRFNGVADQAFMVTREVARRLNFGAKTSEQLIVVSAQVWKPTGTEKLVSAPMKSGVKTYTTSVEGGKVFQTGHASFYGNEFNGRRTASGQRFSNTGYTAAHRTLPMGSLVKVVNPRNGKSVVVRVNDRGPFVRGRIIDLSRAAARKIGIGGVGQVQLIRLDRSEVVEEDEAETTPSAPAKPLEAPAITADGAYSVEVFSLSDHKVANRALTLLPHTWMQKTGEGVMTMYRVYYGRYATEQDAKIMQQLLFAQGYNSFVKKI